MEIFKGQFGPASVAVVLHDGQIGIEVDGDLIAALEELKKHESNPTVNAIISMLEMMLKAAA